MSKPEIRFVLGDPYSESVYRYNGWGLMGRRLLELTRDVSTKEVEISASSSEKDLAARLARDLLGSFDLSWGRLLLLARHVLEHDSLVGGFTIQPHRNS